MDQGISDYKHHKGVDDISHRHAVDVAALKPAGDFGPLPFDGSDRQPAITGFSRCFEQWNAESHFAGCPGCDEGIGHP